MQLNKNLNAFDRAVRFLGAAFFLFAAFALFKHPAARLAAALFGVFSLFEGLWATCGLLSMMGRKDRLVSMKKETLYLLGLLGAQATVAYEWWSAGWEKVSSPEFVSGISKTLAFFAGKNPFPWYKDFLLGFASKNAIAFAYAVEWSQVAIAFALLIGIYFIAAPVSNKIKRCGLCLSLLALAGGLLMNINFYLAAAWTSPATRGSNVVMFWVGVALAYVWLYSLLSKDTN
ncbi:DUF2892 domain-containing protein [Candidatus Uhrbacteria bacterium]|nr:DUF2892 domain-containing protein [Candidatus Uhrbacteria bacterium]